MNKAFFINERNLCVAVKDGSFIVLELKDTIVPDDLRATLTPQVEAAFGRHYSTDREEMMRAALWDVLMATGHDLAPSQDPQFQIESKVRVETDGMTIVATAKDGEVFTLQSYLPIMVGNRLTYAIRLALVFDECFCADKSDMMYRIHVKSSFKLGVTFRLLGSDRDAERKRMGARIKSLREEKGMEAKHLAKLAGIDPANWSRIEQGRYSVGLDILQKVAQALGKRLDLV